MIATAVARGSAPSSGRPRRYPTLFLLLAAAAVLAAGTVPMQGWPYRRQ